MLLSPGWTTILVRVTLLATGALAASSASAQDRCSGTLCDLYYGGPAPDPADQPPGAKPAAPTPLMVPSGGILGFFSSAPATPAAPGTVAAPAPRPMVGINGGGLAAVARGEPAQRCTGTLCDFLYGGPPPDAPDAPATDLQGTPVGPAEAASAGVSQPTPAVEPDVAPDPAPRRHVEAAGVQYEPPRCAATAADPWRCYR